ncbi:MAG: hypothetical protein HDS41_07105 [Bacteroides sp.]|nr:hypothetical protein [Bacteroides sp.]
MNLLKSLTFSVLGMSLLASCDTNDSNTQTFNMGMLYYATSPSGEAYSVGTTEFSLDYSNVSDCEITASGVLVPGVGNSMTMKYDKLTMSGTTTGFKIVSGTNASTSVVCSVDGPWMNTTCTINDGDSRILAMSRSMVFYSITNAVDPEGASLTTSQADKNAYMIQINEANVNSSTRTLNLLIDNAQFKQNMSEAVQLKNINFSISGDRLSFSASELPVYLGVNSPNNAVMTNKYKVKDLSGSGKIGGDYSVSFTWQEIDEESTVEYQVQATLKNLLSTTSSTN